MADSANGTDSVDRSGRLTLFGSLAILLGALALLLAVAQSILPSVAPAATGDPDWRTTLAGLLLYTTIGALLVWLGVGSLRRRRWVPPLMRIVGWTWLIGGLIGLAMTWTMLDGLIALATAHGGELPAVVEMLVRVFLVGSVAGFGVALPALFVWVYSDRALARTCERHDLRRSWTERCPLPVLGLSVGLGLLALFTLPMLTRPVVPLFGRLVVGWPGALLLLAGIAALGWLARSTYRLQPAGWWLTSLLLVLIGVSTAWTLARIDPAALYRAVGYPEEQLRMLDGSGAMGRGFNIGVAVVLTLFSLVYMGAIRKHFRRRLNPST
jgi:hypothetical protein